MAKREIERRRVSTVSTPDASRSRTRTNQDGGKERSLGLKERHFAQGGKNFYLPDDKYRFNTENGIVNGVE
jgi:hypothetical protein